jgi:hypothetical protein
MGVVDTVRSWIESARQGRVSGLPASSNGASSFHLIWILDPPPDDPLVSVAATLTVLEPPRHDRLYFWALQASFVDAAGRHQGGAHLGLQWHRGHPGNTAANWGGYAPGGGELDGSESSFPSSRGNRNTRDFRWVPDHAYRLEIAPAAGSTGWAGSIDGAVVRRLFAGGDRLTGPMVWSEVFARCDDPTVHVQWSDLEGRTASGRVVAPAAVRVNYQTHADGGCANTTVRAEPGNTGFVQITNTLRDVRPGAVLPYARQ